MYSYSVHQYVHTCSGFINMLTHMEEEILLSTVMILLTVSIPKKISSKNKFHSSMFEK